MFTAIIFLNFIFKCRLLSKQRTQKTNKRAAFILQNRKERDTEERLKFRLQAFVVSRVAQLKKTFVLDHMQRPRPMEAIQRPI